MKRRAIALPLLLVLAACGGDRSDDQAQPNAEKTLPAPVATTPDEPTAPTAQAPPEKEAAEPAKIPQVSETSDTLEDLDASGAAVPLKLATMPTPVAVRSRFREGVHFVRLSPVQPNDASLGNVHVIEFFAYGCQPCASLDPKLETWRTSRKPTFVTFERVPTMSTAAERFQARVFYAAERLNQLDKMHARMFQTPTPLTSISAVQTFVAEHGVSAADFRKAFESESVAEKLRRADILQRRYGARTTPVFAVGGKYLTDVARAGGADELTALLDDLAARERNR